MASAACVVGLLGADGGLLWIVAGVWTVRRVWGSGPPLAFGIACAAVALRFRTLSLAGIEVATRQLGAPTVAVEPVWIAVAAVVVLAAVLAEEAMADELRSRSPARRVASGFVILTLVPAFVAPGFGTTTVAADVAWWMGSAAVLTLLVLAAPGFVRRLPGWAPAAVAAVGLAVMGVGP